MKNPFKYGKEVSGYQFYDRTENADELYRHLRDGATNVVLYAPRRYGKTSLVLKVLERLRQDDIRCLHLDLSKCATIEKFCEEYAAAVHSLFGGLPSVANQITLYLSHLHPTFSFSSRGASVKFDYGDRMTATSITEVLDLPEKLSMATNARAIVIAFDEFQEIECLSNEGALEAVFRSAIQSHQTARYVFLGSKTHLMKRMFNTASRPFYKSALPMKIGKPPIAESAEFVSSRFSAEGISIDGSAVDEILAVAENIPYYIQAIAGLAFLAVERRNGHEVTRNDLDFALTRLDEAGEDFYAETMSNLSAMQRLLAEALAREPTARFDEKYRRRHSLPNVSTLHSAQRELIRRGLIEQEKSGWTLGDPFFARYLRNVSAATVIT